MNNINNNDITIESKKYAIDNNIIKNEKNFEFIRKFIDSYPGFIIIVDSSKENKIMVINKAMAKSLGKTPEEIVGTNFLDHFSKEIGKKRKTFIDSVIKSKRYLKVVDERDGRFFSNFAFPIFDDSGNVKYGVAIAKDITDEKKLEENNLLNQEFYYVSLIENSMDIISVFNSKGEAVYHSPSLKKILGYNPEEIYGKTFFDTVHPDDIEKSKKFLQRILSTPDFIDIGVYRVLHKDGSYRIFESLVQNMFDNKQINGIVLHSRDVTEREMAKKKYQTLVENINDGVYILDKNGYFTYVNNAIEKRSGISAKQFNKLHFNDIVSKEYHQIAKHNFLKILEGENVEPYVIKYLTKMGNELFVEISSKPLYEYNKIVGLLGITRDVTEREKHKRILLEQKKYLESLMDSTSEIIFTIDKENMIGIWNKAAEMNTGIKHNEVQGKKIRQLNLFDNHSEVEECIKNYIDGKPCIPLQIVINTKNVGRRLWSVSPSVVKKDDTPEEIVFVCRDITYKDEMHGKLIPGISYLIPNISKEPSIDLFKSLLHQQWNGYYITRTNEELEQVFHEKIPKYSTISSNQNNPNNISNLDELYINISKFVKTNNRAVILLDRIDYLVSLFSFSEVLNTLYKIIDLVKQHQGIFLLRINKLPFTSEQYAFLNEEFNAVPSKELVNVGLEDAVYEILRYIWQQNTKNILIIQREICIHFKISKITAQKRIEDLLTKELVISKKQGRSKYLYATDKGKELLQKHTII